MSEILWATITLHSDAAARRCAFQQACSGPPWFLPTLAEGCRASWWPRMLLDTGWLLTKRRARFKLDSYTQCLPKFWCGNRPILSDAIAPAPSGKAVRPDPSRREGRYWELSLWRKASPAVEKGCTAGTPRELVHPMKGGSEQP